MVRRAGTVGGLCRVAAFGGAALLTVFLAGCGRGDGPGPVPTQHRSAPLVTGTPESAGYDYDGAGNLRQVRAQTAPALTVAGFAPARGGVGQGVVIAGSGFSSIAAQNTVRLNGVTAAVTWATASELSFSVPAGATTGRIAVSVGASSATSTADFTVVAGVEVADFQPRLGRAGTILTVTGMGFSSTPAANAVEVGSGTASPKAATATTLLATVGAAATSGKVKVTAGGSTGTSAADFYLLPSETSELDVAFTARASLGAPLTVSIGASGKVGLVLFEGAQGQGHTIAIGGNTFPGSTAVTVFAPSGATVLATSVIQGTAYKLDLGWLPATGTYTVRVQPGIPNTGRLDLTVFQDAASSIAVDGPAVAMSVTAGQNGTYSFTGSAGDQFAFAATGLSTTPPSKAVTLTFYKPDGAWFYAYSWTGPAAVPQLPWPLPANGTYRIRVVPAGVTSASVTALQSRPLEGTLATDGTAMRFASTRPGQGGSYTFSGTAGQGWTLRATAGSTFAGQVDVYQPSGASIGSISVSASGDVKLDLGLLPATGTYRAMLTPTGMATGALDLRLVREAVDTLTIGAAGKVLALAAAQNGRYTFAATAGDALSFAASPLTTSPTAGTQVAFLFNKPDGSLHYGAMLTAANALQVPFSLPTTGTYTLRITPSGTVSAAATVLLSKPLTGTLSTSGTVTRFQSARPGQTGSYTFAGTAGQGWTLRATAGPTFAGTVYVYQPSGATLAWGTLGASGDSKLDLGLLPATGTHRVVVTPSGLATGYVDLKLVREATGTLTIGAAPKALSLGAGQNGRYTFTGASGDLLSLAVTSLSTVPAGRTAVFTVLRPDGQTLSWNSASAPATWPLSTLPAAGTYTLRAIPDNTASASFAIQLGRR
jgi:hypothetical protein